MASNCHEQLQNSLASFLRVPILRKTGKYLGILSDWGTSKKEMFSWINARVNMKLEGWKENLISKTRKEVLLKTVVQAIPRYAISIFKLPVSIWASIEKRIAFFWWKNSESKKGIHWRN